MSRKHCLTADEAEKLALAGLGMPELRSVALLGWRKFVALLQWQCVLLEPPALCRVYRASLAAEKRLARYQVSCDGVAAAPLRTTQLISLEESLALQRDAAARHHKYQEEQAAASLMAAKSAPVLPTLTFNPEGSAFKRFRQPDEKEATTSSEEGEFEERDDDE